MWHSMKISALLLVFFLALYGLPVCATAAGEQAPAAVSNKQRYTSLIGRTAKRYGVDAALVHALIKVESNYNPEAVSRAGAIGLMQLLPETAADYGVESREALFDPAINVSAGTRHLKRLLKKYKNISHALAAYNAGEGSAVKFRRTGAYIETRKYVVSVIRYYQKYKKR
jgi:soluble lytic murein transglycosylase-like protein